MASARPTKVFVGGLSWATDDARLRQYFSNFGEVAEAFVSYERATGRPRGFGFVVFADPEVASRVVAQAHTIDRREVEAKRAVPKVEEPLPLPLLPNAGPAAVAAAAALILGSSPPQQQQQRYSQRLEQHGGLGSSTPPLALASPQQQQQLSPLLHSSPPPPPPPAPSQQQQALAASLPSNLDLAAEGSEGGGALALPPQQLQPQQPNRKLFVGGLPPSCDDAALRGYFEQFGPVDEAVVMVDHESKRSRGFAFVTMLTDAGLDCVFSAGAMHCLHEKPVEVKRAVPRDQMAAATAAAAQAAAAQAASARAAAAAAAAAASAAALPRNCWEPPLGSNGNGNAGFHSSRSSLPPPARPAHDADFYGGGVGGGGGGPGFAGGSLAAELEAMSFRSSNGNGDGNDFYRRPRSPYGGGGNAPFDRSAFEERGREATTAATAEDSGLVAFLARQQSRNGNSNASTSSPLAFQKQELQQAAPAPSSTHSLSPPEGRYRSLYAPSDVFGPPSTSSVSASAVAGFASASDAASAGDGSGGEGGRGSSGEHQRDEERYGRGFEFFPGNAAPAAAPRSGGALSPYPDSLFGDGNGGGGGGGEW